MTTPQVTRFILPSLLGLGLVLFFATGADAVLSWQALIQHYAVIQNFIHGQGLLALWLYFFLYFLAVTFSLPIASLLTLGGGAFFGWTAGLIIVAAASLGAGVVFLAARSILQDVLRQRTGSFLARLEHGFSKNAFLYLLALRLFPAAPFWVVNIIPAFTKMRFGSFLAATSLGIIPGTFVYVAVGRGFDHILATGKAPDLSVLAAPQIWLPLVGLGLLALLPIFYQRLTATPESPSHDPH